MSKLKVAFFGTPDFAVPCLDMLNNHPNIEILSVISMPDRPAGRGKKLSSPEVIKYAKAKKLKFFQTENINKSQNFFEILKEADIFIVLAFAQFLGEKVLKIPKLGAFNIHTSLLPKYRGAAPIQYALLNGDSSTGVSIQRMVKKMDAGDIVHSHEVAIFHNETGGQLYTRLKFQSALALNDFIYKLQSDDITSIKQDENNVSFAPTLARDDGKLDFKNENFNNLYNKVRALHPWPGTYASYDNKRVKIFKISKAQEKVLPGETLIQDKKIFVGAKDTALRIEELQLEGKKRCFDYEIVNGLKKDFKIN